MLLRFILEFIAVLAMFGRQEISKDTSPRKFLRVKQTLFPTICKNLQLEKRGCETF